MFIPSKQPESKYTQFRANWLAWQASAPFGWHDGVSYFRGELNKFPERMKEEANAYAAARPRRQLA